MSVAIQFDCDANAIWVLDNPFEPAKAPAPESFISVNANSCQVII